MSMPTSGQSSRRIRLGIIGTGLAIKLLHWPALAQLTDRFEVAAFSNRSRGPAEAFAKTAGVSMDNYHADYHDLLRRDDVDAVLVTLPIPLLYPVTREALAAGKDVICEKPAGANLEQGRGFLSLADEYPDRKVLIGENFFYRDDLRLARSLLEAGSIGTVHLMSWRVVMPLVPRAGEYSGTAWRQDPQYRGGPHLDAGVHHLAQIRYLVGDVHDLQAYVQHANPAMGGLSDLVLNLHFVNNAIGSYVAGHLPIPTPGEPNEMRLYGSEGIMAIGRKQLRVHRANGTAEEHLIEADGGYYNQLRNFYDAIVHGEPIVGTIAQSYHNLLLVMRALDSAEEGRVIEIGDVPGGLSASASVPIWRPRGSTGLFDGLPCEITRNETRG